MRIPYTLQYGTIFSKNHGVWMGTMINYLREEWTEILF